MHPVPQMKTFFSSFKRLSTYVFFIAFTVLILGEILVRIFFPFNPLKRTLDRSEAHPYIRTDWVPGHKLRYDISGLSVPSGIMEFEINSFGFRARSMKTALKPAGTTRIFFLGGSPTQSLFVPEEKTFAGLVEKKLSEAFPSRRFEAINQGISGYLAADSLAVLIYKVLYYQPDIVVVMHGVNDMRYGLTTFYDPIHRDGYDKGLYRPGYVEPFGESLSKVLKRSLFLTLFKWRIWNRFFPPEPERYKTPLEDLEEKRLWRRQIPFTTPHPSKGLEDFIRNLEEMIWIARGHGIRIILMTEPSVYTPSLQPEIENKLWMSLIQRVPPPVNLPTPFLFKEMNRFNDAVRDLAKKEEVELIDLEKNIPKNADYFYDDVHLTELGAEKAAQAIGDSLIRHPGPPEHSGTSPKP